MDSIVEYMPWIVAVITLMMTMYAIYVRENIQTPEPVTPPEPVKARKVNW